MKIAWSRCESSCCCVVIDRMMRCVARWHYGLSREDKAVRRGQCSAGNLTFDRGRGRGRKSEGKRKKERKKV